MSDAATWRRWALGAADEYGLPRGEAHTLLLLCLHVDWPTGQARISQERLAREAGAETTAGGIRKNTTALKQRGLLSSKQRRNGCAIWTVHAPFMDRPSAGDPERPSAGTPERPQPGSGSSLQGRQDRPPRGDSSSSSRSSVDPPPSYRRLADFDDAHAHRRNDPPLPSDEAWSILRRLRILAEAGNPLEAHLLAASYYGRNRSTSSYPSHEQRELITTRATLLLAAIADDPRFAA